MDNMYVALVLLVICSFVSFVLGKYADKIVLYFKLKVASKASVDLRKLSLDRLVGQIEEEIILDPTHFNQFLELSNFGIWQYQINTGLLKINASTASLFGFLPSEPVNLEKVINQMIGTFDILGLVAAFENTLLTQTVQSTIVRIMRVDGEKLYLNVKMMKANHYSNQPVIIGNIQQIDQRPPDDYFQKQFYLLAENTSDGIYIFEKGVLTYASEKLKKDFKDSFFENRKVSVEDLFQYIHPEDIENVRYNLEMASQKKLPKFRLKFRFVPNNESVIYREDILHNFYDESGELQRTLIVAKDHTDLKKAKQSINFEAILSIGLVDNFPGFIAVKNYDGEFIFANKNSATMFGINPEDIVGLSDKDYNSDSELIQKYLEDDRKVIDEQKSIIIPKEKGIRIGGGFGYFQTIKIPIDIPGQRKKCVLIFSIDITDRIIQENLEIERKNSLALQNEILYDLANNSISFENDFINNCKKLTEALTKGLNIEYASIWDVKDDQIDCLDCFSSSTRLHQNESPLLKKHWQPYLDALKSNLELVCSNVLIGPFKNEEEIVNGYYLKNNIRSAVDIPLKLGEQFKGIICCEHTDTKEWNAQELAFIRHIGNISLTLWEQELRKEAERRLYERNEILKVTAEVSQILQKTTNLENSLKLILQKIGDACKSSRVYYFTNEIDKGYFRQIQEWVQDGVKPEMDNPLLQSLEYAKIGKYYHELVEGRPFQFVISDIKDPEHYQRLFSQNIKSQLVIPVKSKENLLGYIGFDDCNSERIWSENYSNLLLSIGASIGSAIEKLENEKLKEESQENFKQISETLEEVFWLFDLVNTKFLLISKACFDVFGISAEEGYNDFQFIEKLILEDDFDSIEERKKVISEGIYNEINYKIKTPKGEIRVINEKTSPIFNESGELIKISGIARNVTQKVAVANEVKRLSIVAQKINNGVLISDIECNAIWANNAYLKLFEIDLNDLLGNRPSNLFNTDSTDFVLENANLKSKNSPIEFKVQTFKGNWIWVEMTSTILYDSMGSASQIVEIISDITERKRSELALIENERRLRFITDNTSDGFMIFKDNEIIYYSSQCEKLFGYSWEQVQSLNIVEIFEFVHKDDIEVLNKVIGDIPQLLGKNIFFELRVKHKNGYYFWIEVVVNVVLGDDSYPISSVVVIRNIENRKNMEIALKESKQKLNIILNSLDEVVWAREYPSLKPLFISESIMNIYGISSDDWRNDKFRLNDFAIQEDQPILEDLIISLEESGYSSGTFRIKDKSGNLKWIYTSNKKVKDDTMDLSLISGIFKDVTKIKEAENETQIAKQETEMAQNAYSELELRALQMQMNPHFIFNALNSIQSYIINKDEQMANFYLTKFAALIRQFLDSSRSKYISINEEIANLKLYVELEKLRFDNKFEYVFELDPKVNKYNEIPTMLLQPFIENAINHGLRYKSTKGFLRISFKDIDNRIVVRIEDNGVGRKAAEKIKSLSSQGYKSQGLKITTHRIENYNKLNLENIEYKISDLLENSENIGTLVEIYFPKI